MIGRGVSLYPGLGDTSEEGLAYLDLARAAGFDRLFTSLHIPESDSATLVAEFRRIVGHAAALGFSVTADISPRAFAVLGAVPGDLSALRGLGLDAVRLDFGFSPGEIENWVKNSGIAIVLNASTTDEAALAALLSAGIAPGILTACHNYYPRPESGLSRELFAERSRMFRRHSIPVAAFLPSRHHPRGPLHAGLPTLEAHRGLNALQAAKDLLWGGEVDAVLIGDPLAAAAEIAGIGRLEEECVELLVTLHGAPSETERALLFAEHVNRADPPEGAVRAASPCGASVPAAGPAPRSRGSITIDNLLYRRYSGNLQIQKRDLPPDEKVNVVARVVPEELFLIEQIRPGRRFRLVEAPPYSTPSASACSAHIPA